MVPKAHPSFPSYTQLHRLLQYNARSGACIWVCYQCSHKLWALLHGCLGLQLKRSYLLIVALSWPKALDQSALVIAWGLPREQESCPPLLLVTFCPDTGGGITSYLPRHVPLGGAGWCDDCWLQPLMSPADVGLCCTKWRWDLESNIRELSMKLYLPLIYPWNPISFGIRFQYWSQTLHEMKTLCLSEICVIL